MGKDKRTARDRNSALKELCRCFFIFNSFFRLPVPSVRHSNEYKIKVWELYLLYPQIRLLALPFRVDKAIAHTIGYVGSQLWLYIPTMWCYRYHLHSKQNFARIQSKKIISITPFSVKSFLTPPLWRRNSGDKDISFLGNSKRMGEKTDAGLPCNIVLASQIREQNALHSILFYGRIF